MIALRYACSMSSQQIRYVYFPTCHRGDAELVRPRLKLHRNPPPTYSLRKSYQSPTHCVGDQKKMFPDQDRSSFQLVPIRYQMYTCCKTGKLELAPIRLAWLGARMSICFVFSVDRTKQAIHTLTRATYTLFASIHSSDIQSDTCLCMCKIFYYPMHRSRQQKPQWCSGRAKNGPSLLASIWNRA